jgi:hypothetical protein
VERHRCRVPRRSVHPRALRSPGEADARRGGGVVRRLASHLRGAERKRWSGSWRC